MKALQEYASPTTYSDEELFNQLNIAIEDYVRASSDYYESQDIIHGHIQEIKQRLIHYRDHQSRDSCWGYYADSCNKCKLVGEKKLKAIEECDHCEPPGYFK